MEPSWWHSSTQHPSTSISLSLFPPLENLKDHECPWHSVPSPYKQALTGTWYVLVLAVGCLLCSWLPLSLFCTTASLKTIRPSLSSYFHNEDEGSKKAGVRFGTTGVNYIQVRTLLRASSGCSLILEVRRLDILCKQFSDYRTGTAPIILKGHSAGQKHQGALFGDQRALIC